jgi:nucleoside-diphosphate-sugar epimerase
MSIIVTGGCGMIGSRVVARLPGALVCDTAQHPHQDVTRRDYLRFVTEDAPTGIVHLAGVTRLGAAYDTPADAVRANVLSALHTLEIARQHDAWVILGSTREVQAGRRPQSMYEVTKHTAELLGERYAQDYGGRVLALRFSDVYGADPADSTRMLPTMIRDARAGVVRAATSPHVYCPTHIDDTVDAIVAGVRWITDAPWGAYGCATVCGPDVYTPSALADLMREIVGPSLTVEHIPATPLDRVRSEEPPRSQLARQLIGWRPTHRFRPWLEQELRA